MKRQMRELVDWLNYCSDKYYNENTKEISDYEFDKQIEKLKQMENDLGFTYQDSPTVTVGYEVKSKLEKVNLEIPMLSLDKTKSEQDIVSFAKNYDVVAMLKLDGLSCRLVYENGVLVSANTRGNGMIGEDITHNARVIENIPNTIDYSDKLVIDGEVICIKSNFDKYKEIHPDVKNQRNFSSGSVRLLNAGECKKRNLSFVAWDVVSGLNSDNLSDRLDTISKLGFYIVPYCSHCTNKDGNISDKLVKVYNDFLKNKAENDGLFIDGIVYKINSKSIGDKLGKTTHHFNNGLAFKFYDESQQTTLREIEWNVSRYNVLSPVAIFDSVEIDDTEISRATLHNLDYIEDLELSIGDTIEVIKSNQIIPRVIKNLTQKNDYSVKSIIPKHCPICGSATELKQENNTRMIYCINRNCSGSLLERISHFVSKNAINIDGLSKATIKKFINLGWINNFQDIFYLHEHKNEMLNIDGFGEKSINKLLNSIEKSKNTTLNRFLYSLNIPLIGRTASKAISDKFNGNYELFYSAMNKGYDCSDLDDFGVVMSDSIVNYFCNNTIEIEDLSKIFNFEKVLKNNVDNNILANKTFVITGSLNIFKNRSELQNKIESLCGKVVNSVSKNTTYVINNDIESNSSKNVKAKKLNIPIISESEFCKIIGI